MDRTWLDVVLLIHGLFILFVVFGGLLALVRLRFVFLHLLAIAWGVYIEVFSGICPLTVLESWLRMRANLPLYSGGFIDHYLGGAIYPEGLTREIQFRIGVGLLIWTALVYSAVWLRWRRRSLVASARSQARSDGEQERR